MQENGISLAWDAPCNAGRWEVTAVKILNVWKNRAMVEQALGHAKLQDALAKAVAFDLRPCCKKWVVKLTWLT